MSLAQSVAGIRRESGGNKFGNRPVVQGGLYFHSKREAARYQQLLLLERAGRLRNLRRQVKYRLEVNGVLICTYTADYVYEELQGSAWQEVVEDVKGYPNDRWPMKKKLMQACHGIKVRES